MLNSPLGTGSTFWEGYLANGHLGYGGAYMSAAHGWSTGPTSALTFYLLGIRPTTVDGGYEIAPEPGTVASTEGSLRTPLGDIRLAWQHDLRTRTFSESLDTPPAAVTDVRVPTFGAPHTVITVNHRVVWAAGHARGYGAHLDGDAVVLTGLPEHAEIRSVAAGHLPTTLQVALTSSSAAPVLPGKRATLPVTVRATGDKVVTGTVTAHLPDGWTAAPASFTLDPRGGPATTVVDLTVTAPSGGSGGQLTVPITATAGTARAATTASLLHFGAWPAGTTATASSYHAPNTYNGQVRTYSPDNAIDDNLATFWNDDTSGAFPDTLTVTAPTAAHLSGVGFASIADGVPTDFTVQTSDGSGWTTAATVTGNTDLYRWIPFDQPVDATSVRVVVTASQTQNGNFTRIVELAP
jgi:hypothetical protein